MMCLMYLLVLPMSEDNKKGKLFRLSPMAFVIFLSKRQFTRFRGRPGHGLVTVSVSPFLKSETIFR